MGRQFIPRDPQYRQTNLPPAMKALGETALGKVT